MSSYVKKNPFASEQPASPFVQLYLNRLRPDESAFAHDQLSATDLVIVKVYCLEVFHHLPLSIPNAVHINGKSARLNAELRPPTEQSGHFGAMNDILAWQASDVGTGAADQLAFYDGSVLTFLLRSTTAVC